MKHYSNFLIHHDSSFSLDSSMLSIIPAFQCIKLQRLKLDTGLQMTLKCVHYNLFCFKLLEFVSCVWPLIGLCI